jgi:hypothetical protein
MFRSTEPELFKTVNEDPGLRLAHRVEVAARIAELNTSVTQAAVQRLGVNRSLPIAAKNPFQAFAHQRRFLRLGKSTQGSLPIVQRF